METCLNPAGTKYTILCSRKSECIVFLLDSSFGIDVGTDTHRFGVSEF